MSEYSGNGHASGNGHQKVFELNRTVDPDTIAVLESRRACRSDQRLNRSMKACFDEIADRALNPSFYDTKGVVTISDTALAEIFCTSNRTIYSWKRKIAECGYVWIGKKYKTNMWPLTTYHLSCLHKKPAMQKTDSDGTYGARRIRSAPINPGLGARAPGQPQLPLAGSRNGNGDEKNADLLAIAAQGRKTLPPSPEENFGSEPSTVSGESRNGFRARAEASFGPEPKRTAGQSRNGTPARAEAGCRLNKAKVVGSGSSKGGKAVPTPDCSFEEWKKGLKGTFPSRLRRLETDLQEKFRTANTVEARDEWKRRLGAVRTELLGGPVTDQPAVKAKPARKAPQDEKPMTDEALLESARNAKALGSKFMTQGQRAALQKVGEL